MAKSENREESAMNGTPEVLRERAEHHAKEAERLLKSWWLSTHVKAQVHATLAVYYTSRAERS
jgi:hypothetical protein